MSASAEHGRAALDPREIARCGVFGAAGLLLPVLFHMVQLGRVLMPMYLPLVALAFFVRPAAAAATALVTPLLSMALTGMPPAYPPVAFVMASELALMAALTAAVVRRRPRVDPRLVLVAVLALGRLYYFGVMLLLAGWLRLPPLFVAGLSVASGWPGIVLMLVVIPPVVSAARRRHHSAEGAP